MQTWNLFKTRAGNGHFRAAFEAVDAAVRQLTARHNGDVTSIVLFGSLARPGLRPGQAGASRGGLAGSPGPTPTLVCTAGRLDRYFC